MGKYKLTERGRWMVGLYLDALRRDREGILADGLDTASFPLPTVSSIESGIDASCIHDGMIYDGEYLGKEYSKRFKVTDLYTKMIPLVLLYHEDFEKR